MKRIWAGLVGALLGAPAVAQESEASPYRSWTLRDVRVTTHQGIDAGRLSVFVLRGRHGRHDLDVAAWS